ncbi:hypothetical protein G7Y89_g15134 [Cudoniella acicularis]|uniref:NmrA-like domain-containing protein n=1 Tax=Cudoniella acicularis TaxID=354080 RepID=A0A8H4QTC7_9HELO|nr:hypothetical protein G7Y89_g15134 [Cudoniella acicularis]
MAIKNVAIAGATGTLGAALVKALLASNQFTITALIRRDSTTQTPLPASVHLRTVDYSSSSTLISALKGQDAVISALSHAYTGYLADQRALLDASVAVGVQRFIPSEFGSDTLNAKSAPLPIFAHKKTAQTYMKELAGQGKITYTMVMNGPFLDFGLNHGFLGLNLKEKKYSYVDGGVAKFSTSTLATVGKAVVGVLSKPGETKNRAVYIQDIAFTLKELFVLGKKALGEEGWTEVDGGSTAENEKSAYEKLAKGQKDMSVIVNFLMSAIFREGYGGHFQKLDNELLGIEELKESDVVALIKEIAASQAAAA